MTDYTDLVERLRRDGIAARDTLKCVEMAPTVDPEDALKAADAIEAQAKRIEELEAALKPFALGETAIEASSSAIRFACASIASAASIFFLYGF